MQKILIYTPKITPRIQYIFEFIFYEFSGIVVEFTTNIQFFEASTQPKLSYSLAPISDEIHLKLEEFMWENTLKSNLNFDSLHPIGKIFYALSRYEEYFIKEKDIHGRISGKNRVYKTPFVDQWVLEFQQTLQTTFPELNFKKRKFITVLTCDVDQAWQVKNKGLKRTWGNRIKLLLNRNWTEFQQTEKIRKGEIEDAFDQYIYFKKLKEEHQFEMIFFWLLGDYGKFDKNIFYKNPHQIKLIQELKQWAEIGIHPSYASNQSLIQLQKEIHRLENILDEKVTKSRQHYIKLELPTTYQNLIRSGIQEDYTLYYADETGFRAGTCTPFKWFDLSKNETTNLIIQPFCAMDVTLRNYMNLTPKEAMQELIRLKTEVKKVDGTFTVLFHNSNLANDWKDWKLVLETIF